MRVSCSLQVVVFTTTAPTLALSHVLAEMPKRRDTNINPTQVSQDENPQYTHTPWALSRAPTVPRACPTKAPISVSVSCVCLPLLAHIVGVRTLHQLTQRKGEIFTWKGMHKHSSRWHTPTHPALPSHTRRTPPPSDRCTHNRHAQPKRFVCVRRESVCAQRDKPTQPEIREEPCLPTRWALALGVAQRHERGHSHEHTKEHHRLYSVVSRWKSCNLELFFEVLDS
jgi:hypothetical protein